MSKKIITAIGVCFIFSFTANAKAASCSGTQVSSCGSLSQSNCTSTSYVYNSGDQEGVYCTWNKNNSGVCSDGGAECS